MPQWQEINKVKYSTIKFDANSKLIHLIGTEIDNIFIDASIKNGSFNTPTTTKNNLKIVFTPLHGTTMSILPETLKRAGYNNVHIVETQATPNGDFPTVKSPNPEEPEALKMALELAYKINADIVIGTDPDGDRLGIAVRDFNNKLVLLNGNQSMLVMTKFLLQQWQKKGNLKGNEFVASTIVSTPLMTKLAHEFNVECKIGLTGFKWIAKMIKDHPKLNFIGGGEESFGYMVGDFVRDKDAITATLLACEIAAQANEQNSSFYNELIQLYLKHSFYKEHLISITKKGIKGAKKIQQMMIGFRKNPLKEINHSKVIKIEDYSNSTLEYIVQNKTETITIPKSNVLIYYTSDGSKIAIRPSGTEPKIKFYISVNDTLNTVQDFKQVDKKLDKKITAIINDLQLN